MSNSKKRAMNKRILYIYSLVVAVLYSCSSDKPDNFEPRLLTLSASDISRTEATLHGKCFTDKGVVKPKLWFRFGNDATSMNVKQDATAEHDDSVSLHLSGLTAGTTYYYMLQGSNGTASLSGEMLNFTTAPNHRPTVGKVEILSSGPMSVIVGYGIVDNGGDPVTLNGCRIYCTESNGDNEIRTFVQSEGTDKNGLYRLRIDGLSPNTSYCLTPYATNKNGEAEGEELRFTTSSAVVLGEPGFLSTLIGEDKYKYSSITLAGPLNGDDLRTLRMMAGRDINGNATEGILADIDIAGASIVAGGGEYGESRVTEEGVLGTGLFRSCQNLKHISLPMTAVKIEKDAFADCSSLRSLSVPASVVEITPSAGCTSLESIDVSPANVSYSCSDGVLMSIDGKKILWFPMGKKGEFVLPATVESLGNYAFRDCSIEKIVLPEGLTQLGQCIFYDSKVKEVVLPNAMEQLPTGTFQNCNHLKIVRIGAKMKLLSEYAFDGCQLSDLYVSANMPPVCYKTTFSTSGIDFTKTCRLHVPKGRKAYYRADLQWKVFQNIIDDL
ncbi:MAG: leucine-rich repeat protein [Prevotella sp.]|nr:leucine-rich repeat protein [Prevotella sp.]